MTYSPGPVPEGLEDLRRYVDDELRSIRDSLLSVYGEWYDLTTVITAGGVRGVSSDYDMAEYNSTGIYQPVFDINELGFANFHINHDIKRGSLMYPHIHISSPGTSQENVHFEWTYLVAERDDTSGYVFGSPITKTFIFKVPTVAHSHYVTEVSDVDAIDAAGVDSIIISSLKRVTNGGTDHPNNVFVHFMDIHYQRERLGTPNKAPDFYKGL